MDINRANFNHHLILGLKHGLTEADRELRVLKDKLYKYIIRCMDYKTKIGNMTLTHHETLQTKKSEIETLKREVRDLQDKNVNLNFQVTQMRAFSEEKVKEIESLKNENLKLTKVSQKEENHVKYGALKRKLKTILRNRHNYDDSKVLQDVANVISDQCPKSNKSSLKSCPVSNVCDFSQFNSIIKVDDIEIKIQSLPSPTPSSIQSLSEKSPAASSLSDVSEGMEANRSPSDSGYTTVDFDEQTSPIENLRKKNEQIDFKIEYEANGKHDEGPSKELKVHESFIIEGQSSVSKEICDKTPESKAGKFKEHSNLHHESIIVHSTMPMIDDETLDSKPMKIKSIFEPLIEEETIHNSLPIIDCDIEFCKNEPTIASSTMPMIGDETLKSESIKGNSIFEPLIEEETIRNSLPSIDCDIECESIAENKVSIFEPVFEDRDHIDGTEHKSEFSRLLLDRKLVEKDSSHKSCEDIVIDGNEFSNAEPMKGLLIPLKSETVIGSSTLVEYEESKNVKSKPTTTDEISPCKLSKTDRLFIDVRPLDDPVEVILQEMSVPFSSKEEADSLEEFYLKLLSEEPEVPEKRNELINSLPLMKKFDSNMSKSKSICEPKKHEVISSSNKLSSRTHGKAMNREMSKSTKLILKKNFESPICKPSSLPQMFKENNSSNDVESRANGSVIRTTKKNEDSVTILVGKPSKMEFETRGDIVYETSESQVSSNLLIGEEKEISAVKPPLSQNPLVNVSNSHDSPPNELNLDVSQTTGFVTDSNEVSCGNEVADEPVSVFKVSEKEEEYLSSLQQNPTEKILADNKTHAEPKSDTPDSDIFSVLNKLSKRYEILRQEQAELDQFAQKLMSESQDENETVVSDASEYVVVIQTRDSDCPSERSIDVRDDIINDWIVTDSLNEIDLRREEVELQDSHILEFTSKSPPGDDVFRLPNSTERIYLEVQDERVDDVFCWMDEDDALENKKRTIQLEKELVKPASLEPDRKNFEEEIKNSEPIKRSKETAKQGSSVRKIVVTEDEGGKQEESDSDDICLTIAEDDDLEKDDEDSKLVIVEDEVMVPESLDHELKSEDGKVEQELENEESFEDVGYIGKNKNIYSSIGFVESTNNEPARYNLRRKATLDYASVVKGSTCRKRTLSNPDSPPVKKMFKSNSPRPAVSSSIGKKNISVSLNSDVNGLSNDGTNERNLCLPKFYVENRAEKRKSHAVSETTHFESVFQVIKNLTFEESESTRPQESSLVCCGDSILRTALEFNSMTGRESRASKERIFNFTRVKNHLEEYLKEKKHSPRRAIINLLANVKFTNQTTVCCVIETILLHSSRDKIAKNANILNNSLLMHLNSTVFNDLIFVCLEINKNVFEGFITAMKALLKEKMFSKTFTVDNNSTNLNMISSTIVHSCFYTLLCKATKNVDDAVNLLYESLISMKNRAHPVAYGVFIQWRDILMKYQFFKHKLPCIDIILFCFVHHKMVYNGELYRVSEVQELIRQTYGVKLGEKTAEEHAKETMMKIDQDGWVDAIVLLCKRQMFSWTYKNVIMKYLMPLLRVWKTDSVSEVVLLKTAQALRQIMLSCPYDKEELKFYNFDAIVKVLSDILFNEEMSSRALKESVYLAICELSSRRFPQCAELLSSWKSPDKKFSSEVMSQLNEIMNKKMMYAKWCAFIVPEKPSGRFPFRRARRIGNNGLGKSNIPEGKNIISVGLTRSSRTTQPLKSEGMKKKKKKNKRKRK